MPEPILRKIIPSWRKQEPPPVAPPVAEQAPPFVEPPVSKGRPLSIDEILRLAGASTAEEPQPVVTDSVTPTQPPTPEVMERQRIDILRRQLKTPEGMPAERYEGLGITPELQRRLIQEGERLIPFQTKEQERRIRIEGKGISPYQKVNVAVTETPITVGPVTLKSGEWAGIIGTVGTLGLAGISSLPIAYQSLMKAAVTRNINAWSKKTNTPVDPKLRAAVADWIARTSKPSWLKTPQLVKELFKPSQAGKFVPTPDATTKANEYTQVLVKRWLPEFSKSRTDEVIAGIRAGKFNPDAVAPSVQAVQAGRMELEPEQVEGLRAMLASDPASELTYLIKTSGKMKGEFPNLTIKQYTELVGKAPRQSILTKDGEHVRWEYALDELAGGKGYPDGESLREGVMRAWEAKQQIKALEAEVARAPEVAPTAPVAGVTPAEVGKPVVAPEQPAVVPEAKSVTAEPPPPPPPAETKITLEPPPVEPSGKISFAPLQDIQTVIDYSTKPDISRWLANLPGVRQIMSRVNPSAIANTPAEKFVIGRAVLREEGTQKSQGIVSYLGELGNQEKVFGKLDDSGLISSGKLKGLSVNDIRTYPKKYADRLAPEQKKWIERAHDIEEAKFKYLRDNDIDVKELTFEEGGEYAGRRVFAKISADGEILDTTYIGAGPSRVGKKAGFEKPRSYNTAQEAIADGYRYIPDDEALALNVRAAYNRVADKKASEWLLTHTSWRTNGAPEELVLAAESAKIRLNSSRQLVAAINRAVRGERVPDATLNSIARAYPDEAAELKRLIPQIQAGKPTADAVQGLTKKAKALERADNKSKWAAVNARARAREAAMAPKIGEAMVMYPAFSGKIFTGTEAKEIAETLRKSLDPGMSEALAAINKVNALVRYFKLAGDLSPFGIQLIFLSGSNPTIYGGAAAAVPKILLDPKWQAKFLSEHKPVIDRHPGLLLSTAGTEFTEAMAKGGMLSTRINIWPEQETTLKKLGLVAPRTIGKAGATVLQPFQRVFEGTLDYAGIKMAEALEHLAKTPAEKAEVDQFINEFRGLTSSAKLGVSPNWRAAETATLLAPRYNRAIAALLVDAGKGAASFGQSGIRNRLAIQGLIKGVAAISAVALAISWARGEDWDEIAEHFDPLSPKFFTWDIMGQNIGPGSKVRSVVKLVAQVMDNPEGLWQAGMENPVLRFIRGNLAPVLGSSVDILTGRNYIGDPVRSDVATFTEEMLIKNFMMIWVENVVYEGGNLSQRLIRGAGEFFGGRAYPETTSDALNRLYDRYAAQDFGKNVEGLNKLERAELEEKHPDLAEAKADNEKYWSERGDNIGIALDIEQQKLEDAMHKSLNDAAQRLLDGQMSKYDYDKNRSYIRPYTSGGKSALWSLRETLKPYELKQYEKWYAENTKPEDKAYDDYQEYRATLIEKAELPLDWDALELELENYLTKYPEKTRQYIIGRQDEWIKTLPPAARQVELQRTKGIEDESWWDNYREAETPSPRQRPAAAPRRLTPSWR